MSFTLTEAFAIIEDNMDKDTMKYLKESMIDPQADRGIYETWGGRSLDAYKIVKVLYKRLLKELELDKEEGYKLIDMRKKK